MNKNKKQNELSSKTKNHSSGKASMSKLALEALQSNYKAELEMNKEILAHQKACANFTMFYKDYDRLFQLALNTTRLERTRSKLGTAQR